MGDGGKKGEAMEVEVHIERDDEGDCGDRGASSGRLEGRGCLAREEVILAGGFFSPSGVLRLLLEGLEAEPMMKI
jgi:hypothetical protein